MGKVRTKSKKNKYNKDSYKLFFMALPFIIFVFIFSYLPLRGWIYAFFHFKPGIPLFECEPAGFEYFTRMFVNPAQRSQLGNVMLNTIAIALLNIILSPITVTFAILLNEIGRKSRRVIQSLTTIPHFISWALVYAMAFFMFSVTDGFVNNILEELGYERINFLISDRHIWLKMKGYNMWKQTGWSAIIYLAAISGIDQELYEAATVDGAGRFRRMWHVTLPGVIPTYFVLMIISIGNFINVGMEQYFVFSNAFNKQYIEVLDLYVYNQGIGSGFISYATAIGMLKSIVSIGLFTFANRLSKAVRGTSIF